MEEEFYTPRALRTYKDIVDYSFHTPLQRLGDKPVAIEQLDSRSNCLSNTTNLPVLESLPTNQANEHTYQVNWLEANSLLGDRIKHLSQSNQDNNNVTGGIFSSTQQSEPIYYKPPSNRDVQLGVKEFLPPNYSSSDQFNKVPLFVKSYRKRNGTNNNEVMSKAALNDDVELTDNEDESSSSQPTGDYIAPTVKEALMSQVDTQRQVKTIGLTIIFALMTKLSGKVIQAITEYDPKNILICLYILSAYQILLAGYELLFRCRKSTTFSLSYKQRQLLGLPLGNINVDADVQDFKDTAELMPIKSDDKTKSMPKYKKLQMQYLNPSIGLGTTSGSSKTMLATTITSGAPVPLQILKEHSKQFNLPVPQNIKTRFNLKFKLLFDPKNTE
ncbi:uncharacterized protein KQ657_000712 [Scheffersomyces spartinae]|uniref:Uncharacterized protein n=1 Tax=Scheffersomyces spartinae TaxID=45513 RepID=A0A9P7V8F5_9ASCO|nr:uncharacterized protein KQ657_000712 [Scheffersomyces spartinae]KAG7193301.1 hypothetical protein KQ657_000712 [Scheffersomyces spartinae]